MTLADWFVATRNAHIACVFASGSVFAIRGLAALRGARWPRSGAIRLAASLIDTLLLACGVALAIISHQYPFHAPWLTVKLSLVIVYIVLGIFALHGGRTRRFRAICLMLAVVTFAVIISIAVTRNPVGFLSVVVD